MQERIKKIRKDNNLTQVEFGARIGVKGNTITGYENNLRTPSSAIINSICREFRINEEWLRYGTGEQYDTKLDDYTKIATDIDQNDSKARKAIIDYWNLTEEDKKLFWAFIERFIDLDREDE
jgi:transcriptional regulator with XRE-family HTH domain